MLQQKRIRKPPMPLAIYYPLLNNKPKTKSKKKIRRCTYQMISNPSKFVSASKIYSFYADLAILEHENRLIFEPSLLNRFMKCEGINIIPFSTQKLFCIELEKKKGLKIPHWSQIVKKLKTTKEPQLIEGAQLLRNFCENYEQTMGVKSTFKMISKYSKIEASSQSGNGVSFNTQSSGNDKLEDEMKKILNNYPCVYLKSSINEGRPGFSQMILNQRIVEELGYSFDEFATTVLFEGIPQMMSFDDQDNSEVLRVLLDNYFKIKDQSYRTPQLSSSLFTKDNSIKDIIFQVHFFPKCVQGKIGVDIIIAILDVDKQYKEEGRIPKNRINRNYLEKSLLLEEEKTYFLSLYYIHLIPQQTINPDKVCRVKELGSPPPDLDFFAKLEATKSEDF